MIYHSTEESGAEDKSIRSLRSASNVLRVLRLHLLHLVRFLEATCFGAAADVDAKEKQGDLLEESRRSCYFSRIRSTIVLGGLEEDYTVSSRTTVALI